MRRPLVLTPFFFLLIACGGPAAPSSTRLNTLTPAQAPLSGQLTDLQAARDIIAWNMEAAGGSSYRRMDRICRWELPIPVYMAQVPDRERVVNALDYWAAQTAITYRLTDSDELPRLLIRFGTDGLAPWGGGRALVDGTNTDNSARSGLVVYEPGGGSFCSTGPLTALCMYLYRHELGHVLGILVNIDAPGLMAGGVELSDRERRMIAALYSLPHGARVEADGSWRVIGQ